MGKQRILTIPNMDDFHWLSVYVEPKFGKGLLLLGAGRYQGIGCTDQDHWDTRTWHSKITMLKMRIIYSWLIFKLRFWIGSCGKCGVFVQMASEQDMPAGPSRKKHVFPYVWMVTISAQWAEISTTYSMAFFMVELTCGPSWSIEIFNDLQGSAAGVCNGGGYQYLQGGAAT